MTAVPDDGHLDGPGSLEDNPIWQQDNVTLVSVGIDVGSSGTQVHFSRLHLRRLGEELTSRYHVIERETLYQSPVSLTPYETDRRIDSRALGHVVDEAYAAAGLRPRTIDVGAVILTGEALRRENAARITQVLSEQGGEFVCASAGHNLEAMLAAYGSGAARASYEHGHRLLNVDIGGGTTKLALVEQGRVVATAALHVGGRLHELDATGRIRRLEPAGRAHAEAAGLEWAVGDVPTDAELERVAVLMADRVLAALTDPPLPAEVRPLLLTEPLGELGRLDGVMFSGGVAEYVYAREDRDFGDLGRRIGAALRRRIDEGALPAPLQPAGERIRATVLGASEYTVQLSGSTTYISDPDTLLPRRNLQVVRPPLKLDGTVDADALAESIRAHLGAFDLDGDTSTATDVDLVLALEWQGPPSHRRLFALAEAVATGLSGRLVEGRALYLAVDGDVGHSLGTILRDELAVTNPLLVIDGLRLWDFDFIDLGRIRLPSQTVPVTIKSLIFPEAP